MIARSVNRGGNLGSDGTFHRNQGSAKLPFALAAFVAKQVPAATFLPHYLARSGDLKPFFRALVSFLLRHFSPQCSIDFSRSRQKFIQARLSASPSKFGALPGGNPDYIPPVWPKVRGEATIIHGLQRLSRCQLLGASMATRRRPSRAGWRSNFARSCTFSSTCCKTRWPSSTCCISRPRNCTVTCTLS